MNSATASLGLFGKGRLGTAIAERAGENLAWWVARETPPAERVAVAIEASAGEATLDRIDWALSTETPLVIASTGWQCADLTERIGDRIGVLLAPNLSLTVALFERLVRVLGRFAALDPDRDPYLVEHHHARKRDAPGGTALALAQALLEECPRKERLRLDPSGGPLAPDELSVSAIRAGHTASSHRVAVDAPGETIEVMHTARDLTPYGEGALQAAKWLAGKRGVFTMHDVSSAFLQSLFQGSTADNQETVEGRGS